MIYSSCPKCGGEANTGGFAHRTNCPELHIGQGYYAFEYMKADQQTVYLLQKILDRLDEVIRDLRGK